MMGTDRSDAGDTGARKAAADDDRLSAFRRPNDELTFRDFLFGKAGGMVAAVRLGADAASVTGRTAPVVILTRKSAMVKPRLEREAAKNG
jgi:hypothetical protein